MTKGQYIALLATGGTIAGLGHEIKPGYQAARLNIDSLLARLPKHNFSVNARQIMSLDSCDFTPATMLRLARAVEKKLANERVMGVVITHGTDTLEETSFFLSQVLNAKKPVVLTAAMRPADSISGDGPMNLHQALLLTQNPEARGVLVVLNDAIYSGAEIRKVNASQLAAFMSPWGELGQLEQEQVYFFRKPRVNTAAFQMKKINTLADVPLLYSYAGLLPGVVRAAWQNGAKGLVYAAPGNGSIAEALHPALLEARQQGISVVIASRAHGGMVNAHHENFLSAGWLNPLQARILLQLGLSCGLSQGQLAKLFKRAGEY